MPELLQPEDFESLTGPLVVRAWAGEVLAPIELVVCTVRRHPAHRLRAAPFSLTLSGPRDPLLPQGTYAVRHPGLGLMELFVVPLSQDAESTQYEVTFN